MELKTRARGQNEEYAPRVLEVSSRHRNAVCGGRKCPVVSCHCADDIFHTGCETWQWVPQQIRFTHCVASCARVLGNLGTGCTTVEATTTKWQDRLVLDMQEDKTRAVQCDNHGENKLVYYLLDEIRKQKSTPESAFRALSLSSLWFRFPLASVPWSSQSVSVS